MPNILLRQDIGSCDKFLFLLVVLTNIGHMHVKDAAVLTGHKFLSRRPYQQGSPTSTKALPATSGTVNSATFLTGHDVRTDDQTCGELSAPLVVVAPVTAL